MSNATSVPPIDNTFVIVAVTIALVTVVTAAIVFIVITILCVWKHGVKNGNSTSIGEDLFQPKATENPIYLSPEALEIDLSDEDD